MKKWTVEKNAIHKCVLVNTEKRTVSYNKDLFWVRVSGKEGSELYIYSMPVLEAKP